ncbi:MAG: hypothetical protein CMJ83_16670 [Planctomycetes bacterium]|nr:hypothetical protein [Planctomycetota bacterium]
MQRRTATIIFLLTIAATFLCWGRSLDVPFILDDLTYVAVVHPNGEFSGEGLRRLVWPDDPAYDFNHHLRPLGYLSVAANDRVGGTSPRSIRAGALLLHAVCAWWVALIVLRLGGRPVPAGLAALLVSVHPGAFETLIWVAHRFTLQAGLLLAVAMFLTIGSARRGRWPVVAGVVAVTALLSKDSMLAFGWSLPVVAFAAAREGSRVSQAVRTAVVIGIGVAADLVLRRTITGAWLPTLEQGVSMADTVEGGGLLSGAPHFWRSFAAPFVLREEDPAWWSVLADVRMAGFVLLAALAVGGAVQRGAAGARVGLAWCAALIVLAVPVMDVGEGLAASRRFYVLAAGTLVFFGAAAPPRLGAALMLIVLGCDVAGAIKNQEVYGDVGRIIDYAVTSAEGHITDGKNVVVTGLPAHWRGTPVFGRGFQHFGFRFRPPLRDTPASVQAVPAGEALRALAIQPEPTCVLRFEVRPPSSSDDEFRHPSDRIVLAEARRFPSLTEAAQASGITLVLPTRGTRWPAGSNGRMLFKADPPIEDDDVLLVTMQADGRRAAWMLGLHDPGVSVGPDGTIAITLSAARSRLPSGDLAVLVAFASGDGTPASVRIDVLPPASSPVPGRGSGSIPFQLGG